MEDEYSLEGKRKTAKDENQDLKRELLLKLDASETYYDLRFQDLKNVKEELDALKDQIQNQKPLFPKT